MSTKVTWLGHTIKVPLPILSSNKVGWLVLPTSMKEGDKQHITDIIALYLSLLIVEE